MNDKYEQVYISVLTLVRYLSQRYAVFLLQIITQHHWVLGSLSNNALLP